MAQTRRARPRSQLVITPPLEVASRDVAHHTAKLNADRHDLEFADNPLIVKDPHQILIRIDSLQDGPTTRALQEQIAVFFKTGEMTNPRPRYFEAPILDLDLLERLNYTR